MALRFAIFQVCVTGEGRFTLSLFNYDAVLYNIDSDFNISHHHIHIHNNNKIEISYIMNVIQKGIKINQKYNDAEQYSKKI